MPMKFIIRVTAAALAAAAPCVPAVAQTYIVQPGTTYTAAAVATQSVLGSQMNGLAVQVRFSDGTVTGGSWGFLFASGGVDYFGVANGLFSLSFRGDRDTGGASPSENDFNLANLNPSGETIVGFRLSGALANVVFDRTFMGLVGTPASGFGRDIVGANDPGGNEFRMTAIYRNLVGIGGAAPVGDLFETLDVTFDNPVPEGENYSLFLDTDLTTRLTAVPEPSTVILLASGLAALGGIARRRRV
jgi:hypothetical protein